MKYYEHFCGCCGRGIAWGGFTTEPLWCSECTGHIRKLTPGLRLDLWDCTYFAQHAVPCPRQVGEVKP